MCAHRTYVPQDTDKAKMNKKELLDWLEKQLRKPKHEKHKL